MSVQANQDHHSEEPHHTHEDHDHAHPEKEDGWWRWVEALIRPHGHDHDHGELAAERAFRENRLGIRTVWLALAALALTSILQAVIVWWSGSVALLADTLHNVGDGLNSIPLLIAFYLAPRLATRRYTYGFARAEDVAGVFIVLSIAASAGLIFWESFQKLLDPQPMSNLGWVAAAALVGFLGNEAVALLQMRVGRKIGSAALVADGLHARTDGLTSLAVLLAAGGSWLGYPILDALIGLAIGVTILFITREAAVSVWYRLMDAVDPALLAQAEAVAGEQAQVKELRRLRMRWIGHRLSAEAHIAVDPALTTYESHQVAEGFRHHLFHRLPSMAEVVVHVEPWGMQAHELTRDHEPVPRPLQA